ncbi:Cyclic-di-GMP-binding biofilm dispersal mediator protein [Roseibaca ekhonensis]|uniref:Cyclic-di-GMP-binding biofilm dispersal mediator protein n=1 Tax=Roseinatronobacter ekhonensis TaxID=254356 RepID=A0A3B0M7I5_9RHOB|nr:SDR family oxidoreductase [Roseibaca ekhonensis]SUZ31643.1 Cyclic-di-GMP-binding biofilm dispersal mediator protein [Roseibaca ekhonensis]
MTWFVTGASSGLGLEMVRLLVARGAVVRATGRRAPDQLPADFPDCPYLPCDLSDPRAVAELADWATGQGRVQAAVLNAGAGYFRPLARETPEDIARVLAINLEANITLAHRLRPALAGGRLGLVGSVAQKGAAGMPVYAASKAALDGFGRALAEEWRGAVTVRVLHPGPVATGMATRAGRTPDFADRLFLPPRRTAAALLHALEARRGADRQTVSFLRVGLHRLGGRTV